MVREVLGELADRAAIVARQICQRLAGDTITNRLVSMTDPDARSIRKPRGSTSSSLRAARS